MDSSIAMAGQVVGCRDQEESGAASRFSKFDFFSGELSPYISLLSERWTLTPRIGAGYSPYGVFEG